MKTEYLTELGLTDEQIKAVMAENGKDINAEKEKTNALKAQLTDLGGKLKAFEGIDIDKLQGEVKTLTESLAAKESEYETKLADIEFKRVLETAIAGAKPRNVKAVMALLDTEALKASKNQQADIVSALDSVKSENDYLFEAERKPTGPTSGPKETQPSSTAQASNALRAIAGKG